MNMLFFDGYIDADDLLSKVEKECISKNSRYKSELFVSLFNILASVESEKSIHLRLGLSQNTISDKESLLAATEVYDDRK